MRTFDRMWAGTVAVGVMLAATACSTAHKAKELESVATPKGGENISADVWAAADAAPADQRLANHSIFYWPLPVVAHKKWFEIGPDRQKAVASSTSRYGLGIPYEYLPLENSYHKFVYDRGTAEPVGAVHRYSNLFWSWAGTSGNPGSELEVDVKGVPIAAEWGHEKGYAWYFDETIKDHTVYRDSKFTTILWSLGPAYFHVKDQEQLAGGKTETLTSTWCHPLLLGGILGVVLWSDYKQEMDSPANQYKTHGHGPLLGYPIWYTQTRAMKHPDHAEGNLDQVGRILMVLGGLGYFEYERGDNGTYTDKVKGPLWGLFGTGLYKGDPAYYLLRFPIRKGKSSAAEAPAGT